MSETKTVLVVDDEPVVRMLIVDVLQDLGFTALEAGSGAEAIPMLQGAQPIDLLVTDVGLPGGMDGRELAGTARQTRPDLKVLFVTGYGDTTTFGSGSLESGMAVVTKPFAIEALAGKITGMIGND